MVITQPPNPLKGELKSDIHNLGALIWLFYCENYNFLVCNFYLKRQIKHFLKC